MKYINYSPLISLTRSFNWLVATPVVRNIRQNRRQQGYASLLLVLFLTSTTAGLMQPFIEVEPYQLNSASRDVLPEQNPRLAAVMKFDAQKRSYLYNDGYTGSSQDGQGTARVQATLGQDPAKGVQVVDPVNKIEISMKPKFGVGVGRQDSNQIMYPLTDQRGYLVYTAQVAGIKEDILLANYTQDSLSFEFDINLPDGIEARMESNGSIGVYGSDIPLYGDVSTGSDQDKELLVKARSTIKKNKLMFNIPAPVTVETNKKVSQVKAHYELDGSKLTLVARNLKNASYPLAIDPSVYVETAQKLMRGNNETNVDFDTTNELIKKGELTGGRFDNWLSTMPLPSTRWNSGTTAAGGYIYTIGGMQGTSSRVSTVYWAKLNTSTKAIEATNPGNGACSSWCTNTAYDLPVATAGMSLVSYNGYLYVFGGETATGRTAAVYIAKLGVNGEPSLWHPTDTNKANWLYWYQDTNLTSARNNLTVAAYNNRMYVVGGATDASTGGINTVEVANINPIGTLGAWSTTGMVSLPSIRRSHNIQIYNDRMYLIGGISNVTVQSSVQYIKLLNDGTMAGNWVTTITMPLPRFSDGGGFSAIWGGYLYVAGGCTEVTGTGNWCSVTGQSKARDIELASINADGSITNWDVITGLTQSRTSYGLVAWRKALYGIGGCTAVNETTGGCSTDTQVNTYGAINNDGDVSTTDNSVAPGTAPCSGTNPTNCDIPPVGSGAGQIGRMVMGTALNNGFIYLIGGCIDVSLDPDCFASNRGKMSVNTAYAALAVDGSIVKTASCPGTLVGSWCVDSTNTINNSNANANGLGAMSTSVYNNTIYAVGGTDGNNWNDQVWRMRLNPDGTLAGAWASQGFNGLGLGTARGFMYTYARSNPATAATNPGNLYVLGGCNNGIKSNGIACTTYFNGVYKCTIDTTGALSGSCSTTGQLQLDADAPGTNAGLAAMAGTVYANYMYLIGGSSPATPTRDSVMYAKIDNNNNIVAVSGTTWITSPNKISPARQRNAAFGYNGYLYSLAGYTGTSSLNDVVYAKISVNDGSIGVFATSNVTVNPRWGLSAVVGNGFVYAMGGCSAGAAPSSCTAMTGSVQTFQLYNNYSGTPAGYTLTSNLGVDRIGGSSTILNGYIYYAGGCTIIDCTATTNTVYYAPLNADGTIGTWASSTNVLPAVRAWGKLLAQGGTLYYIGGQDDSGVSQASIYYSTPSGGVPGAWATATKALPQALTEIGASVWNDRLYITGGNLLSAVGGVNLRQSTVYYSPILTSGGNITSDWSSGTGFMNPRSGHTTIAYANNLYVAGGSDGTNYLGDVQYAKIDSTGNVGGWTFSTSLPQRLYQADGFAANGYMYLFGGRSAASTCTNTTFVSSISANTTIASGNNPTGVGDWGQTNVKFNGPRYGAAVAYGDGRAYVLGGGCSAFVATADRSYATALQSQPAVAKYSRAFDTDTDVFPTKWLMNGLDNDVGARWQMKYRSSTNATAAWGQETNFGTVTLGKPENYIPLDGAGINTNFARYYYMNIFIDSSKAFGYPDDVTRGPTVDDISLFFTSDPSKRLRHGATFTGGQLQPLDTPF